MIHDIVCHPVFDDMVRYELNQHHEGLRHRRSKFDEEASTALPSFCRRGRMDDFLVQQSSATEPSTASSPVLEDFSLLWQSNVANASQHLKVIKMPSTNTKRSPML